VGAGSACGLGVGVAVGHELTDGEGLGVPAACEIETVEPRINAANAAPTFGTSADPLGVTLSSIRRISLYM